MIKAVIFDLGGVYFTDGVKKLRKVLSSKYNITEESAREVLEGRLGTDYRIGKITPEEFWAGAKKTWKINESSIKLAQMWIKSYKPVKSTINLIKRLRNANYELLFLSDNAPDRVEYLQSKYRFIEKFDDGVFSHIANVRKPDMKIYKMVLKKTPSLPNECIYIDDKLRFLEPAKKLGMKTIAFKNPKHLEAELKKLGIRI